MAAAAVDNTEEHTHTHTRVSAGAQRTTEKKNPSERERKKHVAWKFFGHGNLLFHIVRLHESQNTSEAK